jgi:hypothetical protein
MTGKAEKWAVAALRNLTLVQPAVICCALSAATECDREKSRCPGTIRSTTPWNRAQPKLFIRPSVATTSLVPHRETLFSRKIRDLESAAIAIISSGAGLPTRRPQQEHVVCGPA